MQSEVPPTTVYVTVSSLVVDGSAAGAWGLSSTSRAVAGVHDIVGVARTIEKVRGLVVADS
jgi:hypothetical protein